jgi:2-isopropylmalate synthase
VIQILDTTLREGEQTPGVYFCPGTKRAIAELLDEVGVDIIEAGNPSVDPDIAKAVKAIARAGLRAKVGAHARCRLADVQQALDCEVGFLGVFLSVSPTRLSQDFRVTLEEALETITAVVGFARGQDRDLQIRFTVEDATRSPRENIIRAASAAVGAGADIISIADTTGCTTPFPENSSLPEAVQTIREELARGGWKPKIEVHCHNDRGLALANGLAAYRAGADIVDASVLGLGERAGIVDLASLILNLRETFHQGARWRLDVLHNLYELVSRSAKIPIPPHHPITGKNAFTHFAGIHVKALRKDAVHYQSLRPELFGRRRDFALGVQSGSASVKWALEKIGQPVWAEDQTLVAEILREVKTAAKQGLVVDSEGEFKTIVERCAKRRGL